MSILARCRGRLIPIFNLLRYFSLTSAAVIFVIAFAMHAAYRQNAVDDLVTMAERHNVALAQSFANTLWSRYSSYVASVSLADGDTLRAHPETRNIHEALKTLTTELPVLKVKIYNIEGLTVYSSQPSQMGDDKSENPGFLSAALDGTPASKLSYRDSFSAFSSTVHDRDLVETYIPIRDAEGRIEGVFELYTDVTPLVAKIGTNSTLFFLGLLFSFGLLYAILFLIIRRADLILKTQYVGLRNNEERIKAKNVELEHEVTERMRLEKQLLQKERLATLGQLTATVSHELRNPLGVIRTSAFIVQDGLSGETPLIQRALERIERSVIRCDRIIDELLDFTRISEIKAEPTPIDAWLDETLKEQGVPPGVALRSEFGMPDMAVPFDRDRFRRAIINVFDNGYQAMIGEGREDTGSEEHTLTVRTQEHDGRAEVIFEDTGPGIPPDVYERIFEPLYSTKGFGVGLGLPVVKQIMEQHGGGIEIETEEGRGTRVCLWLPTGPSTH